MNQSVGFSPKQRLLSGLTGSPATSAYAKGRAMQDASGLAMDREQKNQELGVRQMQDAAQRQRSRAQDNASQAQQETNQRMQEANLANRRSVFDMGMNFDYASLNRRRQLDLQQSVLNGLARDF